MAKAPTGTTKAAAPKTAAPKKAAATPKPKSTAPRTGGIHAPVTPSEALGAIVGTNALPRSEVISKIWAYIKSNKLQNPENKREILADSKLEKVFGGKKATMFEMNKHISKHVKS